MGFVPVCSLNLNQVLAKGQEAKAAGREAMVIGTTFQWTLTTEQILSLTVVSLLYPGEAGINRYRELFRPWSSINSVQNTWRFNQACLVLRCGVGMYLLRGIKNKLCNKVLLSLWYFSELYSLPKPLCSKQVLIKRLSWGQKHTFSNCYRFPSHWGIMESLSKESSKRMEGEAVEIQNGAESNTNQPLVELRLQPCVYSRDTAGTFLEWVQRRWRCSGGWKQGLNVLLWIQ